MDKLDLILEKLNNLERIESKIEALQTDNERFDSNFKDINAHLERHDSNFKDINTNNERIDSNIRALRADNRDIHKKLDIIMDMTGVTREDITRLDNEIAMIKKAL